MTKILSHSPGDHYRSTPKGWVSAPLEADSRSDGARGFDLLPIHPRQNLASSHLSTAQLRGTHVSVIQITNSKVGYFSSHTFQECAATPSHKRTQLLLTVSQHPNQLCPPLRAQQRGFSLLFGHVKRKEGNLGGVHRTKQLRPTPSSACPKALNPGNLRSKGGSTQALPLIVFFPSSRQAEKRENKDKCVPNRNTA